jgi:CelD/BcsL family acetyltransferase involved in cellulose biosynthesis
MKLEWYTDALGLDALRPDWNALLQSSATNTIFLTWEWLRAWWDAFGSGRNLWVAVERDDAGQIRAVLPLFSQATPVDLDSPLPSINIENPSAPGNGSLTQTVHLVGGSEVSDYLDILAPAELNLEAWEMLINALSERESWSILDLRNLPAMSPSLGAVAELARARGWSVQLSQEDVCPVLQLPSTWEAYLTTCLNKKQRHELRRKLRRAEQEAKVEWWWAGKNGLDAALDIFLQLHKASASSKEAFMDQRMEGFFRAVARATADQDWLRLGVLSFDGRPVASYLCFDYQGDRLVYNSGFETSSYRELSPGIVLVGYMIEDAIVRGCQCFNFLQGNERYKYEFGATDTAVMRLVIRR